jgi:hypothetical protein
MGHVEGEVIGTVTELYRMEDRSGHMVQVEPGDWIVGALGDRAATLEGVGSWRDIGPGGHMHALTSAGIMGRYMSYSMLLADPLSLRYRGHLRRGGNKVCMRDFALQCDTHAFNVPTLLLVGTSMSAGKTTAGRRVCKELDRAGLFVVGAKLTGAGRYRDILPRHPEFSQKRRPADFRLRRCGSSINCGTGRRVSQGHKATAESHQ